MATKRGNPDQYLQRIGDTYYARVRVPRTLEKIIGQSHLRRSLKTNSRAQANLRKHAMVARLKTELASLRSRPSPAKFDGSMEQAQAIREELVRLYADLDEDTAFEVEQVAVEHAKRLETLHGPAKATRWFKAATTTEDTLKTLQDRWLSSSDYKESTKAGHRKALAEVLEFFDDESALPSDVTRTRAVKYIETALTTRGLAHATIRDRLVSLGGFWSWLESRGAVPPNANPWQGHRVSKKQNAGSRPTKRAYTEEELLKLLAGNAEVKSWPTYSYLPALTVVGMFTGARIDELCSLRADQIKVGRSHAVLSIKDSKTKAGIRLVGITHPAALAVLKARTKKHKGSLFPELSPGGLDGKLSASAVKAFGRYRRACGVPDGTDFHSFRRNVITALEAAGTGQVPIARFVGHKVGTMAGDTYSQGGPEAGAIETSRKVRFGRKVETAAARLVGV